MEEKTFEEKLKRLEEIVKDIDSSSLGLENSLKAYEEGMGIIRDLENILNMASEKFASLKDDPNLIEKVIK